MNAYQKYDSNDALKVQILISDLESHGTNGLADENHYARLRGSLLSKASLKDKLPHFLVEYNSLHAFRKFAQSLGGYAVRREYIYSHFASLIDLVSKVSKSHIAEAIVIDNAYIRITWQKAMDRMTEDPEGAITIARTLIETVCKHILDESGSAYDDGADLSVLYKSASGILNLSPDQHTQPIFKQILSGCFSVVTGLGSIRNKISDAHGISETRVRPQRDMQALL